ncbi:trigger factor [Buchnera aphidicola]|uniref:Trigger factor n=1 Tax=Buchnera aphidicola (Sarucallis kahawaluokalani) TaxID=1241878 RepID=A0A4D6YAA3_9GAMM|nr:trigger factor [Buchnera aphidicola]QCI26092.1 trigger factor [Buchnera aphidicola (Sarucallis kahawaluokalani)]
MKFFLNKNNDFEQELKIKVPNTEINIVRKKVIVNIKKKINIPGFRKNKIPIEIIQQKYNNHIENKTIQNTIYNNLKKILLKKKIHIINEPKIIIHQYPKNTDLIYSVYFQSIPEINLNTFKTLHIQKKTIIIDDLDVTNYINQNQNQKINWKKNYNQIQDNDKVTIYYQIESNNTFKNTKINKLTFTIKKKEIITQIEKQLINKQLNNIIIVQIKIPAQHPDIRYKNKTLKIKIHIGKVLTPYITYSKNTFNNVLEKKKKLYNENLKNTIKNKLKQYALRLEYTELKKQIIQNIKKNHIINIPDIFLQEKIKKMQDIYIKQYIQKSKNIFYPKYYKNLTKKIINDLQIELIIKSITHQKNIRVTEKEIDQYIQWEKKNNLQFQKIMQIPQHKKNILNYIHNIILEKKIIHNLSSYFTIQHKTYNLRDIIIQKKIQKNI